MTPAGFLVEPSFEEWLRRSYQHGPGRYWRRRRMPKALRFVANTPVGRELLRANYEAYVKTVRELNAVALAMDLDTAAWLGLEVAR